LNTLGLERSRGTNKNKYADSKSTSYLRGTWLKTKKYQTVILAYLRYVNTRFIAPCSTPMILWDIKWRLWQIKSYMRITKTHCICEWYEVWIWDASLHLFYWICTIQRWSSTNTNIPVQLTYPQTIHMDVLIVLN
jgi:hypothetical protein